LEDGGGISEKGTYMLKRDIIEDIVVLLRGFFTTPIISSLGRLGVLRTMRLTSSFTINNFPQVKNKKLLLDTFSYFVRIGLLENIDGHGEAYRASDLGKEIFRRSNSFYVPHSYYEYLYHYHEMIQNQQGDIKCEVERAENVIGSGKTHERYFPPIISFLKRKVECDVIVDIGCGDGQFLSNFSAVMSDRKVVGIDISRLSVEKAYKNLREKHPQLDIAMVCSDALDVKNWSKEVHSKAGTGKIVIAMWFLLHEISKGKTVNVVEFLGHIHELFPTTSIVIGDVIKQPEDTLSNNNLRSIMPEYLFIHEISGQGILFWQEYQEILKNISYDLLFERLFDEIHGNDGNKIPSAFVWCLRPKKV
jgi:SAM-dependent methyltransferase